MNRPIPAPLAGVLLLAVLAAGCTPAPTGNAPAADPVPSTAANGPVELAPVAADSTPAPVPTSDPWSVTTLSPDGQPRDPLREPDVIYLPTPHEVVAEMLRVAEVGADDVLYDLGSGDGRIPITAARQWGTRGVGIEIDPLLVEYASHAAAEAGVAHLVRFVEDDMFEADLSQATVVSLYLLPDLNLRLRPKLLSLAPGTRIVGHNYHMGDWLPEESLQVGESVVYLWRVPEDVPEHLRR
ncbi:hypothetical protein LY625_05260 [Lysobacter sp. GX 14042]|uniref:hypothetical protein n=1 Tax=Lysobacter sp. GX 14042 TaxID=2907155 RepID=UPI001F316A3D|nr:hypothetical protein [Lysobacter sp. GX 14042]MCE7032030.1 hypothetical protein [Lysobacter sp. GX 14042]